MNIGMVHLPSSDTEEVDTSPEAMASSILAYTQCANECDEALVDLQLMIETQTTLTSITDVIKDQGVTEGLVSMIGSDFIAISEDYANKEQDVVVADFVVALEGLGEKVKIIIARLIAAIKNFINTIKVLFKKSDKALTDELKRVKKLKSPVFKGTDGKLSVTSVTGVLTLQETIAPISGSLMPVGKMLGSGTWDDRKLKSKQGFIDISITDLKEELLVTENYEFTNDDISNLLVTLGSGKIITFMNKIIKEANEVVKYTNPDKLVIVEGGSDELTPQAALAKYQQVNGIITSVSNKVMQLYISITKAIVEK